MVAALKPVLKAIVAKPGTATLPALGPNAYIGTQEPALKGEPLNLLFTQTWLFYKELFRQALLPGTPMAKPRAVKLTGQIYRFVALLFILITLKL